MSTLVKILLAVVLQFLHAGETDAIAVSEQTTESWTCNKLVDQLQPNHLVSKDEVLSQLNERAL